MYLISVFRFFVSGYIHEVFNSESKKQNQEIPICLKAYKERFSGLKQRMFDPVI